MPLSLSGPNAAPLLEQENAAGQSSQQSITQQVSPPGLEFKDGAAETAAAGLTQDPIDALKASVTDQTQAAADLLAQWLEQDDVVTENG